MTKRFELKTNFLNGHVDIVDWAESEQKDAICIFNDLGVLPFSSAPSVCNLLNQLNDENERLKQEHSVFEGKDAKHYQRWVNQIKKYVEETNTDFTYDDDFIIKIALSYTLQSLRNGESLKRFQWDYGS